MNRFVPIGFLTILVISSLIVAGIQLIRWGENEIPAGKLSTFPILVGEKIYEVSIRSNYSSEPEVNYSD